MAAGAGSPKISRLWASLRFGFWAWVGLGPRKIWLTSSDFTMAATNKIILVQFLSIRLYWACKIIGPWVLGLWAYVWASWLGPRLAPAVVGLGMTMTLRSSQLQFALAQILLDKNKEPLI